MTHVCVIAFAAQSWFQPCPPLAANKMLCGPQKLTQHWWTVMSSLHLVCTQMPPIAPRTDQNRQERDQGVENKELNPTQLSCDLHCCLKLEGESQMVIWKRRSRHERCYRSQFVSHKLTPPSVPECISQVLHIANKANKLSQMQRGHTTVTASTLTRSSAVHYFDLSYQTVAPGTLHQALASEGLYLLSWTISTSIFSPNEQILCRILKVESFLRPTKPLCSAAHSPVWMSGSDIWQNMNQGTAIEWQLTMSNHTAVGRR